MGSWERFSLRFRRGVIFCRRFFVVVELEFRIIGL